jgi:hypothetical protein
LTRSKEIKVFLEDCLFLLALGMVFLLLGAIVETASMVA